VVCSEYDVIVVGGGPAGSTAASTLALAGRNVLLLERETFPRYHIGESLVPAMRIVTDSIGVTEKLESAGFIRKYGAHLLWGDNRADRWSFTFLDVTRIEYVYEVKRAIFDNILLEHARSLGVTAIEGARVKEPVFTGGRCVGVSYSHLGQDASVRAPWVVDASGQRRLFAKDAVEWHEELRNIAVWTYFQGGEFYPDKERGHILVENLPPDGWLWVIPFKDSTHSVGFVGPNNVIAGSGRSPEEVFWERLDSAREAKRILARARPIANFRTARDWSYTSRSFIGPGYVMAGDAAAFIDPLFSSGVMLAMRSANSCAQAIDAILNTPEQELTLLRRYDDDYRSFLRTVRSFVTYFYDASKTREKYYEEAQRLIDPIEEMTAREDFVLLVSGLIGETPIFDTLEDENAITS
jgi:FAD-dependent halogenase